MNICGNSGLSQTNLIGYMLVYPESVWYDPKVISNILSMVLVEKKSQLHMETKIVLL